MQYPQTSFQNSDDESYAFGGDSQVVVYTDKSACTKQELLQLVNSNVVSAPDKENLRMELAGIIKSNLAPQKDNTQSPSR